MKETEKIFKNPDKRIHVLQIGMTKNVGGLETYLMQQFRHLDKSKITYDFVNITAEDDIVFKQEILEAGSHVYGVMSRHSNPIRHYWQWLKLLHKIGKNYKVIVLNSNGMTYVFPLVAARLFRIPMRVIHSHNSGFEQKIGLARKAIIVMNKILLKWGATDYFACSKIAGEWMFGENTKFTIIPNAIDINQFKFNQEVRDNKRKELNIPSDYVVIGHVGRFTYQKNHAFLIDIFYKLLKVCPNAKLLLIGDGPYLFNIKRSVSELRIEDSVFFLGRRNDVPQLLQAMDCFVLPSRFEGLPIVGVEAQAAGVPCIVSDAITRELNINGLVRFVSLRDKDKWVNSIMAYHGFTKRDQLEKLRNAGYDISLELNRLVSFYENIVTSDS